MLRRRYPDDINGNFKAWEHYFLFGCIIGTVIAAKRGYPNGKTMPEELCGKTNDAVVPQRLGGRNWKTVRQSSLLPQPFSLRQQWAGEKSKSSPSRSVSLIPLLPLLPRLQCPELYLARTKPLCHLFKGLFFLFLSLFLCSRAWHSILSLPPSPGTSHLTPTSSVRMVSSRKPMSWASFAPLRLQSSSSVGC